MWSPTHVQFTVLRARKLIAKGKGGNNDVFVTIQLGKEKFQTSTIKNALNPEWFEECDLPIPHLHTSVEVTLFHRGVLSDDFLGYAAIPVWEHKITESPRSSWVPLQNKPNAKSVDNKYRGELEVKLTFHCQTRNDAIATQGLKKRSSSIRNIASAFGDKLKFTRSRSFRENRRDPEGGKPDKKLTLAGRDSTKGGPEDGLVRSYSMSAAYIKSMSLDRSKINNYTSTNGGTVYSKPSKNGSSTVNYDANNINNSVAFCSDGGDPARVSQTYSHSMQNLPGNRRSCVDLPFHHPPPAIHDSKPSSKDDSAMTTSSQHRRAISEYQINSAFHVPTPQSNYFEPVLQRERPGIYESIKERTEPENSGACSSSDLDSVPGPRPRMKRFGRRDVPAMGSSSRDYSSREGNSRQSVAAQNSEQQAYNARDSGILEDRSSSHGNSLDSTPNATDGVNLRGRVSQPLQDNTMAAFEVPLRQDKPPNQGTFHLSRDFPLNGSGRNRKKVPVPSLFYCQENSVGELVVKKRSRGERDRLRQHRHDSRRYTIQGLDNYPSGLYDDSLSEPSDNSRPEVSEDLLSVFKNMTKEELLRVVIQSKAQMIRKDQYIKDLENYIDDLLVRVMETTPRLLNRPNLHRL